MTRIEDDVTSGRTHRNAVMRWPDFFENFYRFGRIGVRFFLRISIGMKTGRLLRTRSMAPAGQGEIAQMADIRELIDNFEDDSDAQRQLIELIGRIVEPVLRDAMERWHVPIQEIEDLRQEFLAERVRRNWKALKDFRGTTEADFSAYWQEIARHLGDASLGRRVELQRRESEAIACHIPHDGSGAGEAEIRARLDEMSVLTVADWRVLRTLLERGREPIGPSGEEVGEEIAPQGPTSRHAWLTRVARLCGKIKRSLRGED